MQEAVDEVRALPECARKGEVGDQRAEASQLL